MFQETLLPGRGSNLRRNGSSLLNFSLEPNNLNDILIINNGKFITESNDITDLIVEPNNPYMLINKGNDKINIQYDDDVSIHKVIYDPYKYEKSEKKIIDEVLFRQNHNIQEGYIDILSKWYSIKFTYPTYNLIYLKPEMGISIQIHEKRIEKWEILSGKPIVINGNKVHYYVENKSKFQTDIEMYHSVIHPNKNPEDFVLIKEEWSGIFEEEDIIRLFNPNNFQ